MRQLTYNLKPIFERDCFVAPTFLIKILGKVGTPRNDMQSQTVFRIWVEMKNPK